MRICTEEIERCQHTELKPNFVVLLDDKYGWQPLPYEIEAELFENMQKRVLDIDDKARLERWYLRDDNANPASPDSLQL